MAITGILQADFSAFVSEAQKAEVSLKRMEGGADKVENSLNRMTDGAPARINTLRDSFSQVDHVLAASGVNVGKYARGLIDIEQMAGKTVTQLGYLSTGVAVFGAAMAGWNFGRAIAGFLDLDAKIGNVTAKLLGWGDVAGEEAAAGADALALATKRAGHEVTTMSEALIVNTKFVQDAQAAIQAEAEAVANAVRPQSDLMQAWNEAAAAADGFSESSTILGDGLPPVTENTQSLLEVLDGILAIQEPIQSGLTFTAEVVGHLGDEADDTKKKIRNLAGEMETVEAFKKRQLAGGTSTIQPLTQTQLTQLAGTRALLGLESADVGIWKKLKDLEAREGNYHVHDADSYFSMVRDQVLLAQLRMWASDKERPPGFRGGVTNFGGGLAMVHQDEMLVNLPAGTDVIPAGRGGGGNTFVFNLSGMVGDRAGLARSLKQTFVEGSRASGQRISGGGS